MQIQITPTHQGKGIATRVIGDLLSHADRARGPVALSVLKRNRAINLYQRLGFQVIGTTDTSLQMRRGESIRIGHNKALEYAVQNLPIATGYGLPNLTWREQISAFDNVHG
ncbi:GNAT family N-acetyltransferase [Paraburkholderia sp.]|uniref:GNAT family N-acetyltransferase n=1 Tax=Paraburkholderia sp. TaxID=1926495 RepID=UPI0039E4E713